MQYRYPQARLLVFTKSPIAGQVKTRMQPALSALQCVELQQQLIEHTLQTATNSKLCPVELWVTDGENSHSQNCAQHFGITLYEQQGLDLGERMLHAFNETLAKSDFAIIIGCDCPALSDYHLQKLMPALDAKPASVALIPAIDGGYVAIGLNSVVPVLFHDISWGSDQVLQQTRNKITRQHLNCLELEPLWDLDRAPDLQYLRQLPDRARWEKFIYT
ncbi:MAG: TIGR04282 family arsenosugar biosynthesis glycosyltransferase [Gammaproteobacteria bacterium]|nr:TIGR04282 family arsenosugar biosynthesis glycosyltransferase [Gammaproteobacteria bacterium]